MFKILKANIKPAQDSIHIKTIREAKEDIREKLRADLAKKIAKEIIRNRLKEKLKTQDDDK